MTRTKLSDRVLPSYTKGEEIFNMVSHIVGGALGIVAVVLCTVFAALNRDVYGVISGAIYGFTMILLYAMSSIYHGLSPQIAAKKVFQVIDHCSIFLLIAGTYTPITLCALRKENAVLGWSIFGAIWAMAFLGITLNSIDLKKYNVFSVICYLAMGCVVVFEIKPTAAALGVGGTVFLLLGGLFYLIGYILYGMGKHHRYMHSIFHLFVVAGSLMHFFCILFYIIIPN